MENCLEVDSIYRKVNDNLTLSDIYFKCEEGKVVGIVGRNGSGKSILMRIVFGIEQADNKFIRVLGKNFKAPYKKRGLLAYLPQHSFLPQSLKVAQVIRFYLGQDLESSFANDEIIEKIKYHKVSTLSGGELRYLEVRIILKMKVRFVLLDEPFSQLSPLLKERLKGFVKEELKNKGIVVTDHDYFNLEPILDTVYLMNRGNLKLVKDKEDLVFWNYLPQ